jgi:pilus assembly protein CpaF
MSGMDLPSKAIREQIASAVDIIVHESRLSDGSRKVTTISEVVGQEGTQIVMQDIFEYKQTGINDAGKVTGHFTPTGAIPTFLEDLKARGLELSPTIFQPANF